MFEGWPLAKRKASRDGAHPGAAPSEHALPIQLAEGGPLDALGQQSESVRDRVNRMVERLDEVRSLSTEFGSIVGPLNDFVNQHAASRARLLELEALLARERNLHTAARTELNSLQTTSAKTFGDLQEALAALIEREEAIRHQDAHITELRIRMSDLKGHADSLDTRLFAEADRAKALADENAALRREVGIADESRVSTERSLAEARETLELTAAEASRLQALVETLSLKVAGLNRTVSDLEPQLQMARSTTALVQGKFAAEQAARQKSEASRDAERAANEVERASQAMKIDGLNAQAVNTEKLIAHLRDQLHDKGEALRVAEKGLRDATADKLSLERRLDAALDGTSRIGAQLADAQRAGVDTANRADMLAKAMAAKNQALDAASRKSAALLDRIEALNARFALERTEFEAGQRRMVEELQNERAERSLAQGALDIARKSRSSLLIQYTALRRRTGAADSPADESAEPERAADNNVMAFAPPEAGA